MLTAEGRKAFRERMAVDEAAWVRGRGWALWKLLTTCAYGLDDPDESTVEARRALTEILAGD